MSLFFFANTFYCNAPARVSCVRKFDCDKSFQFRIRSKVATKLFMTYFYNYIYNLFCCV